MKVVQITEKDFALKRSKLSELLPPDELSAFPHLFGLRGTSAERALGLAARKTDRSRLKALENRAQKRGRKGCYLYLSSCSGFHAAKEPEMEQRYGALVKSGDAAFLYADTAFCNFRRRTKQGLGIILLAVGRSGLGELHFDEEYAEDRQFASPYIGPFSMYLPAKRLAASGISFIGAIVTSPEINSKLRIASHGFGSPERFIDYSGLGIEARTMQSAFLTKLVGLLRGRDAGSLVDEADMKSIWDRMNEIEYAHSQRVLAKIRDGGLPVL
ncbi:MAG TPA: hypothetical protein VLD37_07675 [Candidatus Bilamarchaeum sp.]|nr:hypothetical protein [Candidatus Bilamarchaeum sp.]